MIVIINEDYQVKVDNYANYTLLKAVTSSDETF